MSCECLQTTRWIRSVLGMTAGTLILLACGGQSDSDDDDDSAGTGASGGAGPAGAATNSGTGGTVGSTGGSQSTGSSGGNGGTSGVGNTTDGSGGSGTGSAGSAGMDSGGSGGSGGLTNPVPDPELVDACAATCALELEADCPNGPTEDSCAGGCELITRVPACESTFAELYDCIEEDDTTSCSGQGEVVFDNCVSEQLAAYTCVLDEAPDEALEEPCENYCNAAVGAMCPNDENDLAGCIVYCQSIGTILPVCEGDWRSVLECGQDAEFECDDMGNAQAMGCGVEALGFFACVCDSSPELCTG